MVVSLIVALDSNNGISRLGKIPWSIPIDRHFFHDIISRTPSTVIIGKNTSKFIKTRSKNVKILVSTGQGQLKGLVKNHDNVFIGGGREIYREALESRIVDRVYLTEIKKDYQCDNIFPRHLLKDFAHFDHKMTDCDGVQVQFSRLYHQMRPITENEQEQKYLDLLEDILNTGHYRQTRNGKTWSKFGKTLEFDLSKGFPLLTTKKMFFKGILEELLFFLRGDTNAGHLSDLGVKIWDANTSRQFLDANGHSDYEQGDMGPMYGFNLVHFGAKYRGMNYPDYHGFNQLEYCLNLLKTDPFSRRILMTTYNPATAGQGVLYPCHGISIQFNVSHDRKLSCMMTQRSADAFLGLPFNIASYALLTHIFCHLVDMKPGKLLLALGDVHIYEEHREAALRQILREPFPFPTLDKLELVGYKSYPNIKVKMIA